MVVNQAGDILRSVSPERVVIVGGRNFVLRGVSEVCCEIQDRFSTAWCSPVATATRASSRLMSLAP